MIHILRSLPFNITKKTVVFCGCMYNLDPSHYITILIIFIMLDVITNFEKSCSVMIVVCSVVIVNILTHTTVIGGSDVIFC